MAITQTAAGLVDSDQFTRANAGTPGGNWTVVGTASAATIVSNRLDIAGGGGSPARPGAKMDGLGVSRTENFGQCIQRYENTSFNSGFGFITPTGNRDGYTIGINNTVLALQEWSAGNPSNVSLPSQTHAINTDYTSQFYSADGVQEGFSTGGTPATEVVSGTDTAHDGVAKIFHVVRASPTGSANSGIFDDVLWMKSKNIIVAGLPSGYKAKVINGGGSVVATATESGGTATIDCSRFGGASEFVPFAGWPKLRITDGADVTIEEYTATAVYPGDTYNVPAAGGPTIGWAAWGTGSGAAVFG